MSVRVLEQRKAKKGYVSSILYVQQDKDPILLPILQISVSMMGLRETKIKFLWLTARLDTGSTSAELASIIRARIGSFMMRFACVLKFLIIEILL